MAVDKMRKMRGILLLLVLMSAINACSSQRRINARAAASLKYDCGNFDLDQLDDDLQNGYFERAGVELAKAVLVELKLQLECKKSTPKQEDE